MTKTVVLDEWHLTVRVPATLPDAEVRTVRRVLNGKAFTAALRRAVAAAMSERPELKPVRVHLTR